MTLLPGLQIVTPWGLETSKSHSGLDRFHILSGSGWHRPLDVHVLFLFIPSTLEPSTAKEKAATRYIPLHLSSGVQRLGVAGAAPRVATSRNVRARCAMRKTQVDAGR